MSAHRPSFRPPVYQSAAPFPPLGPVGLVPQLRGYYGAVRLLEDLPGRSLSSCCPVPFRYSSIRLFIERPQYPGHFARAFLNRLPHTVGDGNGILEASQVPGEPIRRARLSDPGGSPSTCVALSGILPSVLERTSAPHSLLSRLNDRARTVAVYASPLRSPATTQDSLPAGCQPWLGGRCTHRVPM
jgi:hypothetical protein